MGTLMGSLTSWFILQRIASCFFNRNAYNIWTAKWATLWAALILDFRIISMVPLPKTVVFQFRNSNWWPGAPLGKTEGTCTMNTYFLILEVPWWQILQDLGFRFVPRTSQGLPNPLPSLLGASGGEHIEKPHTPSLGISRGCLGSLKDRSPRGHLLVLFI